MKNPFKLINPGVKPPVELENAVFKRLSVMRLLLNIAKLFTHDMVKTGVDSIDGIQNNKQNQPTIIPNNSNSDLKELKK